MSRALFLVFVVLVAENFPANAQSNSWNGITPLKSTRSEVEKMVGSAIKRDYDGAYDYRTADTSIAVYYSTKRCDDGWNVPKDVVLSIRVYPKASIDKSAVELELDRKQFFVTADDALFATWTDPKTGRLYYFGSVDRQFIHMGFIPTREQNSLRCDGWPPYRPEGQHYPFQTSSLGVPKGADFDLNLAASSITNLVSQISQNHNKYQGYVIVYFNRELPIKEYRRRVSLIKKVAFGYLKASKQDLQFIEGGMRSRQDVEFYLLPRDFPPPAPAPTLPSPQFSRHSRASRQN